MPRHRILVTGSTGLLGATLIARLRRDGYDVVAHGMSHSADLNADLASPAAAEEALSTSSPDFIVNLVGLTDVDRCEKEPSLAERLNVGVVGNLARWTASRPGARLVHVSTDQVYSGNGPHDEQVTAPCNVYGRTKLAGEGVALDAGGTVLRTNFFGRSRAPHRQSLSDWMVSSLRAGSAVTFFTDSLFSPLRMETLAEAIARVLEHPVAGAFNLGSRDGMSKYEFGSRIATTLGLSLASVRADVTATVPGRAPRPKDMRMKVGRFEEAFSFMLPTLESEIGSLRREYETSSAT